jgi:hypothetical protein
VPLRGLAQRFAKVSASSNTPAVQPLEGVLLLGGVALTGAGFEPPPPPPQALSRVRLTMNKIADFSKRRLLNFYL